MTDDWVLDRSEYWWTKLNQSYGTKFTLPTIEITDRKAGRAGYCSYHWELGEPNPEVTLYEYYIKQEGEKYDSTIGHELAHAYTFMYYRRGVGHSSLWKQAMIRVGLPPLRCHSYNSPNHKPIICPCGKRYSLGPTILKRMMKEGQTRWCLACKRYFAFIRGDFMFFSRRDLIPV